MIKHFFKKLIKPKSKNEDLRRHEFILNVLLICSIFFLSLVIALIIFMRPILNSNPENGISLLAVFLALISYIVLYILSRKGYFVFSAFIFVGIYFALSIYMIYLWGFEVQASLLFFVLIIVLSGILISTRFSFLSALLSALILSSAFITQEKLYTPNLVWKNTPWGWIEIFAVSIIFFIIATVSWLSNREIEKSLRRARKSEMELKEERDLLEIKIKERTKQLQKEQAEKMTQLSRFAEFGRLSSGLFHDLVNPLTAVSLNIEKIKHLNKQHSEFKEIEADIDRVLKTTHHMEEFITTVRKQIANQKTLEIFSLNKEIEDVIKILKYPSRKNKVEIIFETIKQIQVLGNPISFNQVILNLISNAIDSYPTNNEDIANGIKRKIKITLKQKNNFVKLLISDNGSGIPQNLQEKIFEPFFTTKDFNKGTGIGLSLTKRIIEGDFNGKIKVTSEEGKGSMFIIKFKKNNNI